MLGKIFTFAVVVLMMGISATKADTVESFLIFKGKLKCANNSADNAETRNCINNMAVKFIKKMRDNAMCNTQTCIVRVPCVDNKCNGNGYRVIYEPSASGNNIHITLASGKKAEYGQCGTCNGIDPRDEKQIPVELLPGNGGVILEFPAKYK